MKKLIVAFSLFMCSPALAKPAEVVTKAVASSAKVGVGGIVGGSAVAASVYSTGTLFLSNDHVCQWTRGKALFSQAPNYVNALNTTSISLTFADGETVKGRVVYTSNSTNPVRPSVVPDDLCLIYVDRSYPSAALSATDAEIGEEVFSVGAPHGWFPHIAGGYVGGYLEQKSAYVGSASLMIGEGSSGGGIFNKVSGELIGIAFAIEPAADNVPAPLQAYYVPVSRAQRFLSKYKTFLKNKENK